jgi:hypothetical protein
MTEDIDDAYLMSLASERVARIGQGYDKCRLCNHGWHGLRCQALGDHCPCETSMREAS